MADQTTVLVYTLVFVLYSILEITGALPQEVISAGLSLPALFKRYYGDEEVDFVKFHVKRTTAAIVIHCMLPMVYLVGLQIVYPHFNLIFFWQAESTIVRLTLVSLLISLCGIITGILFIKHNRHPFIKILKKHGGPDVDWRNVAYSINTEYRVMDKFVSVNGLYKVVMTDRWIITCGIHSLNAVKHRDATILVEKAEELRTGSSDARSASAQYLVIKRFPCDIRSQAQVYMKLRSIRLTSDEYTQLRDKVTAVPIQVARQVVIQQSLDDRFLQVFSQQVFSNGSYRVPGDDLPLEPCFGCSQNFPEVKLKKMCSPLQEGECRSCDCKPMWCLSCMSKWFASRQDQGRPDTWLSSQASCPLCRKRFCMLDILMIEQ